MQTFTYNYYLEPTSDAIRAAWVDFNRGIIYLQFHNGTMVSRMLPDEMNSEEYVDSIESWGHYWHDTLRLGTPGPGVPVGVEFYWEPTRTAAPDETFNTMLGGEQISGQDFPSDDENVEQVAEADDSIDTDFDEGDYAEVEDSDEALPESAPWGDDEDGDSLGDSVSLNFYGISEDDFTALVAILDETRKFVAQTLPFGSASISAHFEGNQ